MGKLRTFQVNDRMAPLGIWGGGHTLETDPTRLGWSCRPIKGLQGSRILLLAQRDCETGEWLNGCATMVRLSGGFDVALYDEKPGEVAEAVRNSRAHLLDPQYRPIDDYSGFGLTVIEWIHTERDALTAFRAAQAN